MSYELLSIRMKKLYTLAAMLTMSLAALAAEKNDTTYVMLDFNLNPWNYPVAEVTKGWSPDCTDWDNPAAIMEDRDFSWPVTAGSTDKIKVTVTAVDLDEYEKVPYYASYEMNEAEAAGVLATAGKMNMLYTNPGTTMRFEAPAGYKFGKMVFYNFRSSNFLVGDDYDEEHSYTYGSSEFTQKLKFWVPTSPKVNQYGLNLWEGDEKNVLFNYPSFSAVFVKIDIRLVPDGTAPQVVKGDANGDGVVNVSDVASIVNYMLEKSADNFSKDAADVNGDNNIDVSDVVKTVGIIVGQAVAAPQKTK